MIFAFDLDGTLNRHPKELREMMLGLRLKGCRVIVLTAVPLNETEEHRREMLAAVGITISDWDEMVMVPDDGISKGCYCRDNQVSVLIDDAMSNLENVRRLSPATCCLHVI